MGMKKIILVGVLGIVVLLGINVLGLELIKVSVVFIELNFLTLEG